MIIAASFFVIVSYAQWCGNWGWDQINYEHPDAFDAFYVDIGLLVLLAVMQL